MSSRRFLTNIPLGYENLVISFGTGSPESVVDGDISSLFFRSDASDSATSLYIKNAGTGNTGWLPVAIIPSSSSTGHITFCGADGNLTTESDFTYDISSNTLTVDIIELSLGSSSNPSLTLQGDLNTGIYGDAADILGIAAGGSSILTVDGSNSVKGIKLQQTDHRFVASSTTGNTVPSFTFADDTTSGFGRFVSGPIEGWACTVKGSNVFYAFDTIGVKFLYAIAPGGITFNGTPITAESGSQIKADDSLDETSPTYSFRTDTDTGFFRSSADTIGVVGNGVEWLRMDGVSNILTLLTESQLSFQDSSTHGNAVNLKSPSSLLESYTLSWPLNAPANQEILKWNSSFSRFEWTGITYIKAIGIESPGASENIALFFTDDAITITQINDVARGSTPSVTWNIRHATTRNSGSPNDVFGSNRTTTSESGAETTSFTDATIPAGSWVWLITSATSGTVNEFTVSIEYTKD